MAYLGQEPISGNFVKLDNISVVNGQATYSMQRSSVNYSPASVNHMIVSLNGVIQSPGSSYTISAHQITFASNLVTGDVIDFIMVLGDVLNIGTPSDNTVTNDKLATAPTIISKGAGSDSGAIKLNCENNSHGVTIKGPPHSAAQSYTLTLPSTAPSADKALITDGSGNLSFGSAGGLVKLASTTIASGSEATEGFVFANIFTSTYTNYKIYYNIREKSGTANATNGALLFRFGSGGSVGTTGSTTIQHALHYIRADTSTNSVVYGDGYDIGTLCQNFSSNEEIYASGFCEILNPQVSTDPMYVVSNTLMHGTTNNFYHESGMNLATANTSYDTISFMLGVGGGGGGGSLNHTTTKFESYGTVTVYGIVK